MLSYPRQFDLAWRFEDKLPPRCIYRGKMFRTFVHLYNGPRKRRTGVIKAMKAQHDWFCTTYLRPVHALLRVPAPVR